MELRDYQVEMLGRLRSAWAEGKRSVMVQMPTGTGKTVLLAEVIRQEIFKIDKLKIEKLKIEASQGAERKNENGQLGGVLIVAHRRELIEQIQEVLNLFGIKNEIFKVKNEEGAETHEWCPVYVESIQRLTALIKNEKGKIKNEQFLKGQASKLGRKETKEIQEKKRTEYSEDGDGNSQLSILNEQFDLVIIDEAHHALAKTYRALWERWPKARFLGLTATPCRLNGAAFTDLFDVLLQSQDIQRFIEQGWLSDFEYVSVQPDSEAMQKVRGLKKRGADGDYQTKELATVMDVPESIEHLYSSYHQYARGKKGIVYAIDRAHAQHIAEYYREHGVRCAVIDATTPAKMRSQLVQAYLGVKKEKGKRKNEIEDRLDVLINVDIFSEGFDCPEVEFIQLARPTLSLAKYLQQVGRGMRVSKGKPYVTILDNVGLYQMFGLPTDNRDWQGMFLGKMAGKGDVTGTGHPLIIRDEVADKQLINLEMLHVKRFSEKRTRIEVFLLGGRFGIMRMGHVTCAPQFRRVQRLHHPRYYALAVYDGTQENYTTIIDREGQNMKLAFRGEVSVKDDIFIERDRDGRCSYYDAISGNRYVRFPVFRMVAGLEVVDGANAFYLRNWEHQLIPYLSKAGTRYNDYIVVTDGILINKTDGNRQSRIQGYLDDSVLVLPERGIGFQQVFTDGRKGIRFEVMPKEATLVPDWKRLGLTSLSTMSREYVDEKERNKIRLRYEEFVESLVDHNDAYLEDYLGLGFQVHHAGYTEGKNMFIAHSHVLFKDIKTLSLDIRTDGNTATLTGKQKITYLRNTLQQKEVYDFCIKMKKRERLWWICGIWYEKS